MVMLLRWRLKPGKEDQFREGWRRVTKSLADDYGAGGSRLHRTEDGVFVAYARWPSLAARKAAFARGHPDPAAARLMEEATEERLPDIPMTILDDYLTPEAELPERFHAPSAD